MDKQPFPTPRFPGLFGRGAFRKMAALVVWGLLGCSVAYSADWEIHYSHNSKGPGKAFDQDSTIVGLRANVDNRLFLFVKNQTKVGKLVTVQLSKPTPDDKGWLVLPGKQTLLVPAESEVLVNFAPPPEKEPKDAKAVAPPPPLVPLKGPPFKLRFEVLAKDKGTVLANQVVYFRILPPEQIIAVNKIRFEDKEDEGNALFVEMVALKDFFGPPAKVDLVLLPGQDLIEGLILGKKEGVYSQKLYKKGDKAKLVARNLQFDEDLGPKRGKVYVAVDGYSRAFRYLARFSETGPAESAMNSSAIRIPLQHPFSEPKEKLAIPLEVDTPGFLESVKVKVELLVRTNDGKEGMAFEPREVKEEKGARRISIGLATADPTGALSFKTKVEDWQVELDTAGLFGEMRVRAQLLDNAGNAIEGAKPAEVSVVFDDTPPQDVRFAIAKFPRQLERGQPLPIEAMASDPESGISRAAFFLGKPLVNKAGIPELPPNVEVVQANLLPKPGATEVTATALLPIPADKKGLMDVSVLFVNGANQTKIDTIKIEWVEPGTLGKGGNGGKKFFKIEGKVLQGDSAQPNLPVLLRDEKGVVKATAQTASGKEKDKARGTFIFANVPPGVYTITSANSASRTRGQTMATVETTDVSGVEIKLLR